MPRISESFPSRFLSTDDLPEHDDLVLTITRVEVEQMNTGEFAMGKPVKEDKLVVYFDEVAKGLTLNKTNATTIKKALGNLDDTAEWCGRTIALYRTRVNAFGELVPAIRARDHAPHGPSHASPAGEARVMMQVLGHVGAKRLLDKLTAYGKTYDNLLLCIKNNDLSAWEQMSGRAMEDLPESCFEAIQHAFEVWDKHASAAIADHETKGAQREITDEDIPF